MPTGCQKWVEVDCPDLPAINRKNLRPFIFFMQFLILWYVIPFSNSISWRQGCWSSGVLGRECWISQFHFLPLSTSLDMTSRTTRLSMTWGQPTLSPFLVNLGLKELTDAMECAEHCWTCFVLPRQNPRKNNKGRGRKTGHVDTGWTGVVSSIGSWYIEHRNHRDHMLAGPHSGWICMFSNVNSSKGFFCCINLGDSNNFLRPQNLPHFFHLVCSLIFQITEVQNHWWSLHRRRFFWQDKYTPPDVVEVASRVAESEPEKSRIGTLTERNGAYDSDHNYSRWWCQIIFI